MTKHLVRVLATTLVLAAALAVSAGAASAHGGGKRGDVAKGPLLDAAATYIGVTQADIRAARQAGQSLAQLATSKGKTVQGLTDALVKAGNASIDTAQAAGKLTADQATKAKAALPDRVTALVNATGSGCTHGDGAAPAGTARATARRAVFRHR
jgi:hypothetical protein